LWFLFLVSPIFIKIQFIFDAAAESTRQLDSLIKLLKRSGLSADDLLRF